MYQEFRYTGIYIYNKYIVHTVQQQKIWNQYEKAFSYMSVSLTVGIKECEVNLEDIDFQ